MVAAGIDYCWYTGGMMLLGVNPQLAQYET
jgi:hypothetical protein